MRKFYMLLLCGLLLTTLPVQAQTILEEDFETGATVSQSTPLTRGEGWTTVNSYSGNNYRYNWFNEYRDPNSQSGPTISGAGCAACDAPTGGDNPDGAGPREEILLSPELDLKDTYQLQFTWMVSPMNNRDNSKYDLQVRVVTDNNISAAETVFSIQNEQMLRESGVIVFPIDTWDRHTSKIDLSDWKGEKVKLAFVFKMLAPIGNIVWIDDITVKKFTPATGPVAQLSMDRYDFKDVYIGEKLYSEVFTLTNVGKNGLQITGMELPAGIGTTLDAEKLNLRTYDEVAFQLFYEAQMTTPASGDIVLHTTGGDAKITFSASKQLVPEGSYLETFNGYFPPAGWRSSGFYGTQVAIEGDQSAYCGGDFSVATLRSPLLDLTDGGVLKFSYYNQYDGEYAPEYDIEVQVSYDGGDTWITKWVSDYENGLNQLLTAEVDLGIGSDESYVRFYYPAVEMDDEGAYDHSSFTLDRVLLPNVVGMDGVPGKPTLVSPANNATGVYPKDIKLEWGPAQFAAGYRVYVGTNTETNDLVDGVDVGDALTYTISQAAYETNYRWKVVPYNDKGNAASVSTWRFTTQPDASVMEFPYEENFDELTDKEPPTGWLSTTTITDLYPTWTNRRWEPLATNKAYGGKGVSMYTMWLYGGYSSTLTSPEFNLPAEGKTMSISFVWGDNHPASLIIDETGLLQKQNVAGGNGYSDVVFEIYSDGEWKQAAYLSENYNEDDDTKYWRNETVDLTEYAGKKVQFRWINHAYSGAHKGAGLDNIVINGIIEDGVAFNKESWDAGKVNYQKANSSENLLTIRNSGKNDLKVKNTSFKTNFFQTSIVAGDELKKGEGKNFTITFNATEASKVVEDELTIEFENDYQATFPVKGESLAEDVIYYAFEKNALDYDWKTDFTQIDVDKKVNYDPNYYETIFEAQSTRYAFIQVIHNNENLTAHTGKGTIAAAAPDDNSAADDWLISKQIVPAEGATVDFYARNMGTTGSVFVGDNDLHRVSVLVSEAGNTKTADFKVVMNEIEMPYLDENKWNHYTVDLSAYAGKKIYVALRHTTISANWFAFFDDLTFTHVSNASDPQSIQSLRGVATNAELTIYTIDGVQVAKGRGDEALQTVGKGVYVVKVKDGDQTKTLRMIRK